MSTLNSVPSDTRFVACVAPLQDALETVCRLQGVHLDWRLEAMAPSRVRAHGHCLQHPVRDVGLLAQDVANIVPQAVIASPHVHPPEEDPQQDDVLLVQYEKLVPLLIESTKTLAARVDALEAALKDTDKDKRK
jgi:hypothetical protein